MYLESRKHNFKSKAMKKLGICLLLFCVGLFAFFQACVPRPTFPFVPNIKFESISKVTIRSATDPKDSIIVAIRFEDGNGDLGLGPTDTLPPYQTLNADRTPNEFFFNYYVRMFRKNRGRYEEVVFTGLTLNGRFPLLNTSRQNRPLQGVIRRGIEIRTAAYPFVNDTVRFEIQIADRALNKSNIIRTDSIVINTR